MYTIPRQEAAVETAVAVQCCRAVCLEQVPLLQQLELGATA